MANSAFLDIARRDSLIFVQWPMTEDESNVTQMKEECVPATKSEGKAQMICTVTVAEISF
jgi:hypothetical protein